MPKNKSDHLYQLIKSLAGPEKRYFKLFAAFGGAKEGSVYLELFDALDKAKEYDEEAILKAHPALKRQVVSSMKNYLHKQIMKSLDLFHAEDSPEDQVKRQVRQLELLYKKQLYDQCFKLIRKAKKTANEREQFLPLLEVLGWERNVLNRTIKEAGTIYHERKRVSQEEREARLRLENMQEYRSLHDEVSSLYRELGEKSGAARNPRLRKVMQHPLLKDEKKAITRYSKGLFYVMRNHHAIMTDDRKSKYRYTKKHLELLAKQPARHWQDTRKYLIAANNHLHSCQLLGKDAEFGVLLHDLKQLDVKGNKYLALLAFETVAIQEGHFHVQAGRFNDAAALVQGVAHLLDQFQSAIRYTSEELIIIYLQAYALFGAGEFRKSLHWLNRFFNEANPALREDYHYSARLLYLVVLYELQRYDLLDYAIRSSYRFFSKRKHIYKAEHIIIHYLKKLAFATEEEHIMELLKKLYDELSPLMKDPYEKRIFNDFDMMAWMESKIEGRPFAEVVREKAVRTAEQWNI